MRVIIQRVKEASVFIENNVFSSIQAGLLVFVGIETDDTDEDIEYIAGKIHRLRIFNDDSGVMNLSVSETGGDILAVSQFTLHASTKKGNRPSYIKAARPEIAIPVYEKFVKKLSEYMQKNIKTGVFAAMMDIKLVNDGPVTILMDSKNKE